jgi:hypothetical protein
MFLSLELLDDEWNKEDGVEFWNLSREKGTKAADVKDCLDCSSDAVSVNLRNSDCIKYQF